jgi:hypothetical protein
MLYPKDKINLNESTKNNKINDIFWVIDNTIDINNICIWEEKKNKINKIL